MPVRIAIVGAGATGALAAVHLARRFEVGQAEIVLIEPRRNIGRGLAYSTHDPRHLLNVRVGNMSAFADQPDHLLAWLREEGKRSGVDCPTEFCFIPRSTYGDYIGNLVGRALASRAVRCAHDTCVYAVESMDSVALHLESSRAIVADRVVLATGFDTKPAFDDAPILIVGSGPTMVDMAVSLDRRGHRGPITVVSRPELLPSAHRAVVR